MRKLLLLATVAFGFAAAPAFAQTQTQTTPSPAQPGTTAPGRTTSPSATTTAPGARPEVVSAVEFVRKAAISDMFEIQSGQLAMQRAQNQQVRQFAQEMVQDHQKTTNELQQLIRQMHGAATPPGGTSPSAAGTGGAAGTGSPAASGMAATGSSAPSATAPGSAAAGGGTAGTGGATLAQAIQIPTQLDAEHQQKLQRLQQAQGAEFDRLYAQQQVEAHQTAVDMFQNYARSGDNAQLRQFAQRTLPDLQDHLRKAQQMQSAVARG